MEISPGWKLSGPSVDPQAGAVDVLADVGDEGQQQQADADEGEGVAVALEVPGPADDQEGDDEGGDPDRGPHGLQRPPRGWSRRAMNT